MRALSLAAPAGSLSRQQQPQRSRPAGLRAPLGASAPSPALSARAAVASLPSALSLSSRRRGAAYLRSMSTFASAVKQSEELFLEASRHFVKDVEGMTFAPTSGGVNNVVQYATTASGDRFILRIYNNGFNFRRVLFEHAVLKQLEGEKLSFELPISLPTLKDKSTSFVKLSNGAEACFFKVIPGALPKAGFAEEIGRASGELMVAMGRIAAKVTAECPTAPYWDLYKVHHAVTREKFLDTVRSEAFDHVRGPTDQLVKDIMEIEELCKKYMSLPSQLIHGDLHYDNVLVHEVSGLLDFEFSARDWRAMELAICLSKYAGEKDPMPYFDQFCTGFAEFGGIYTEEEIQAMPDLINLRILSNVVYFVGRALAREDGLEALTTRAQTYATRVAWVKANAGAIRELVRGKQREAAARRAGGKAAAAR